jgi:hypothetical protein
MSRLADKGKFGKSRNVNKWEKNIADFEEAVYHHRKGSTVSTDADVIAMADKIDRYYKTLGQHGEANGYFSSLDDKHIPRRADQHLLHREEARLISGMGEAWTDYWKATDDIWWNLLEGMGLAERQLKDGETIFKGLKELAGETSESLTKRSQLESFGLGEAYERSFTLPLFGDWTAGQDTARKVMLNLEGGSTVEKIKGRMRASKGSAPAARYERQIPDTIADDPRVSWIWRKDMIGLTMDYTRSTAVRVLNQSRNQLNLGAPKITVEAVLDAAEAHLLKTAKSKAASDEIINGINIAREKLHFIEGRSRSMKDHVRTVHDSLGETALGLTGWGIGATVGTASMGSEMVYSILSHTQGDIRQIGLNLANELRAIFLPGSLRKISRDELIDSALAVDIFKNHSMERFSQNNPYSSLQYATLPKMAQPQLMYVNRTHVLAKITVATGLMNVPLTFTLVTLNSAVGAAQAVAVTQLVTYLLTRHVSAGIMRELERDAAP